MVFILTYGFYNVRITGQLLTTRRLPTRQMQIRRTTAK